MRRPVLEKLEKWRHSGITAEPYGHFVIPFESMNAPLTVVASAGLGWEHVSVSLPGHRCPTWEMMDYVKRLFWEDSEVVMQLHINDERKVNTCSNCLHLWRPMTIDENEDEKERWQQAGEPIPSKWASYPPIPLPPKGLV